MTQIWACSIFRACGHGCTLWRLMSSTHPESLGNSSLKACVISCSLSLISLGSDAIAAGCIPDSRSISYNYTKGWAYTWQGGIDALWNCQNLCTLRASSVASSRTSLWNGMSFVVLGWLIFNISSWTILKTVWYIRYGFLYLLMMLALAHPYMGFGTWNVSDFEQSHASEISSLGDSVTPHRECAFKFQILLQLSELFNSKADTFLTTGLIATFTLSSIISLVTS